MDLPSLILLGQEQGLRRRLDVVANNMANVSTAGFKREQALFRTAVNRDVGAPEPALRGAAFVRDFGAAHDLAQGAFTPTGNALDLAIEGPGYFTVADGAGGKAYLRAGQLQVLPDSALASAGGQPILGENGQPITVAPDQRAALAIAADGTVTSGTATLGRITVTRFADEAGLVSLGNGLHAGTGGIVLPAEETRVVSGGLEASNVEPIGETTQMIEIMRAYQSSVRMAESLSDMRQRALDRLARPA